MMCHNQNGHLGQNKCLYNIKERFFWPKLHKDVKAYIESCDACQRCRFEKK